MNLGVIYIRAALVLIALGFVLGSMVTAAFLLIRRKRVLSTTFFVGTLIIGLLFSCIGLMFCHNSLFRAWHRHQNEAVPAIDCVTYEPTFWYLYATYKMDQQSFNEWIALHPWCLKQCKIDGIFELHDGPHFGLTSCQAVYESPRGPKGNNLRVYYQSGVAYISYSAM